MKKTFVYYFILLLVSCGGGGQKVKEATTLQVPLNKSDNNDLFNLSFGKLLGDYYFLKDNFITENDTLISYFAKQLMVDADSLKFGELKADSAIILTAKSSAESISDELKGLLGEKDLESRRKSFSTVGEQLYDLVRTVQYNKSVVYHDHCPMAFNEAGANWLSNSSGIKNPYIPKKMPTCGSIMDTLDFSTKK
jgi:hypothetical protein